ncbi:MAG: DegT/DnrJ/EryC1/StrS family aminotransferase, partial [Mariprofundaceae bacterium]|nr:DegT/DnrJ/EryC1/StrS family aminotransferase [Mariprofundaceae bacterium]
MIPHSRPSFDDRYVQAVSMVVRSAYTAEGEQSRQLEQEVLKQCQQDDAVAVDSGTSALMLALRALQTEQNIQKVGIPAYACASLWFAVRAAGCTPVLMDCGEDLRLDKDHAWKLSPTLDTVILVHPFGMVEPLVAESWDCPVIEDIAQAAGATFQHKAVGSFGDIVIASFYATKPWGGAYGGMVLGSTAMCDAVRMMSHPDDVNLSLPYVGHHQLSNIHASLALVRLQCAVVEKKSR